MSWPYKFPIGDVMKRAADVDRRYREAREASLAALPRPKRVKPRLRVCGICGVSNCFEHEDLVEDQL